MWPAWLEAPAQWARDPQLDEAAALLCARNTNAIVDSDVRRATGVSAARVRGFLERGDASNVLRARLNRQLAAMRQAMEPTHMGLAEGVTMDGQPCLSAVAIHKLVTLETDLPAQLSVDEIFPLGFTLPQDQAVWYLADPYGRVQKRTVKATDGVVRDAVAPRAGQGHYILEIVVQTPQGDPQVAILWPFRVGNAKGPPRPAVLFPDAGHSQTALIRRAEALVQRLRNEQELRVLTISPQLAHLADERASSLAENMHLGHDITHAGLAEDHLYDVFPEFKYSKLSEVQAQAGTLAEAWFALLDSPAHRYELVKPEMTHLGVGIIRDTDTLGRPLVSLVMLMTRSISQRDAGDIRTDIRAKVNLTRSRSGLGTLKRDSALSELAQRQASAMAEQGRAEDGVLGRAASEIALEQTEFEEVRVVMAQLDEPLRLEIPSTLRRASQTAFGVGAAQAPQTGLWMICILIAR